MKTALAIMAAGIGSRYGGGIKQLERVDEAGHIIMDYCIHDAIEAGFDRIVFIIRKDIEKAFREAIGSRIEAIASERGVEIAYAFQERGDIPEGFSVPEGRMKPWGTGQAILAAKDMLDCPFAVINADDYYGRNTFRILHDHLVGENGDEAGAYYLMGFILKNTLSEHGGVTRGICSMDDKGYLTDVRETKDIVKTPEGASVNGEPIDAEALVSLNMWGLTPDFLKVLEDGFVRFFREAVPADPLKAEYLLPIFIGELLRENRVRVKVLETEDSWFGVTYQEDKPAVVESFRRLVADGVYSKDLYEDLARR